MKFYLFLLDLKRNHRNVPVIVMVESSKPESLEWDLRNTFDIEVFMPIPNESSRLHILKKFGEANSSLRKEEWEKLAKNTLSFVYGDLKNLIEAAIQNKESS